MINFCNERFQFTTKTGTLLGKDRPEFCGADPGKTKDMATRFAPDRSKIESIRRSGKPPTLKTISELSGFAVQTVSRALSDAPDISQATKETVRKLADEVGYIPNRAGVRLRTGKTNVISLVLSTDNDVLSLTSRLISSIAEGLRDGPYHLVVTSSFPEDDPLKAVKYIVQNGTADAIILNQIQPEDPRVKYLLDAGFPFVTHGRTVWADMHSYYDYDNEAFGRIAVQKLAQQGRKNILLIAPPQDQNYGIEIVKGVRKASASLGLNVEIAQNITSDDHRNKIRSAVTNLATQDRAIDAIISASPNATMAAIAGMEDKGAEIGTKFDIFSKETVPILDLFRPGILKINEDVNKAGRFLADAARKAASRQYEERLFQELDHPSDNLSVRKT